MISPRPEPVGAQVVLHQRCGGTCRRAFELDAREFWASAETSERTLARAEAMIASRIRVGRRAEEYTLCIPAPGPCGFGMSLYADSHGIHVSLGGLEQEFSSVEEAMPWVRRVMSPSYRLHIVVVGRKPAEWTLEDVSGERPLPVLGSSRLTFFRRFRVVSHLYRSNGSRHHEWCASAAAAAPGPSGGLACPGGSMVSWEELMAKQRVLVDLTVAPGLDLRGHPVLPRADGIVGSLDGSSRSFLFEPEGGDQTLLPAWLPHSARLPTRAGGKAPADCEEIIASWLSSFRSETTRRKFGPTARRFLAMLAARDVELKMASDAQLREAMQAMVSDVSGNTARQYLVRLRSFLAHAQRRGTLSAIPAGSLQIAVPKHRRGPVVGASDLSRLFKAMSGWDRLMSAIMIAGDLQPSEVAGLCWGDVTRLSSGSVQLAIAGKRRRVRRVVLPCAIGSRLLAMRGSAPACLPVFGTRTGRPLVAAGVNGRIREAVERAGLDPAINARALRLCADALLSPGFLETHLMPFRA